jgi:hypothetical protein
VARAALLHEKDAATGVDHDGGGSEATFGHGGILSAG